MSADGPSGLIPAILAGLTLRGSGLLNGRPPRPAANTQRDPNEPGHETRDVNVRNTVMVMAGLALTVLAVVGTMIWLMDTFAARHRPAPPAQAPPRAPPVGPPPPHPQAPPVPPKDRARAAAEASLAGYGYRDEARTRARIPIGRAMDLIVGRSLEPAEPAAR
jgi:type IV secretory pathway VirB10-like protein